MGKRIFQVVFLAIAILISSLTTPFKAMEVLVGNSCPAEEREFVDHGLEASDFDVSESLLFEGEGELAENPYACSLLWKVCGIRECNIPSKDTIGTNITQWNRENSIELDVSTGTFKLVTVEFKDKEWQLILCNNTENLNDYGKPTMPYKKLLIPLNDAEVVDVEVEEECTKEFFKVDILPGFKPLPLGSSYLKGLDAKSYFGKHFYADPSIYQSDGAFPSSTITYETVVQGSNRILVLKVFPFKFYPTRSKIGVFDIHINIELSKPAFGSMRFSSSLLQEEDPGYVIVTPSAFSSAVESLATWKEQLGFSVQKTTLEYIYNNFPGRDKAEKLREFIKESYYTNGSEYYLLVGDCDVCPAREVWDPAMGPGLDNGTEPCDLYFECLDGDWDADGDSLFGEMEDDVDFYPEVKVGRLPVNTVQEVTTVCEMIKKIEEDPEPGDWIKKFLLLANTAFTYGDCAAALDEEINQKFLAGSFFDVTRLYDVDGSLSPSAVVAAMNQGVGLVDFFDHGAYDTWVGALQTSDVLNLLNGNKTFLAFAMACETAAFDYQQYTTIAEAFFKNPNGGAIAYIGATRVAWAGYDCFDGLHDRFWRNLLTQAIADEEACPKDALQSALTEMVSTYDMSGPSRETVYQTIYFGDPALNLYWKHNITTTATPDLETNETGTLNGICRLLHSGIPISGQYQVVVRDSVGNLIAQQSGSLDAQGSYTVDFSTSAIPGNYTVETSVASPFNYTHISTFPVGALNVTLELSSIPVYGTLLGISGQVLDDGIPVAGQANISIINNGVIVGSKVVVVNDSGQYETQINITTFGRQELHVWASSLDDTKHGGTSAAFKVKRGDILILADDSGEMALLYPGGWYDLNRGSSTSYYYFYAALEDEYNVSVYRILYDPVPDLNLLQQYSAVVVTCGDHYGACLTSMYRDLTEVLTQYHNSGGNLLFEGGDLGFSLSSRGYTTFMQSVLHASLISDTFNTGLYVDNSVPHSVTQGLPSLIFLEGGLGSPSVDVVSPANESEMVSGYAGYVGCSIIAFSGEASLGHVVYFSFSIDGIADVNQRELLIKNSIGYITFPTLTAWLSDYALQVNTAETILVQVRDANTGQLIENAIVTFTGCGVSAQSTTDDLGECSIFIAPGSSGIIDVTIQKAGYLDFTAQIVVYSMPKFMVKIVPEHLKRGTQTVDISVTDFYEGNPVADVYVTLVGCGVLETGYTNLTGEIQFVVTPTSYGNIQLTASKLGYEDYTTLLGVYIKAAVVDSYGTDLPEYSWWDDLNYLWENYGTTPIEVDIKSLDKYGITYEDLVESRADVLIIPCAAATGREYTDSEISAIKKYTLEGHGLIATAGTLYYGVPNNNKLAPLFGMREDIVYFTTWFSSLNILEPTHPLFVNIPSPYFVGYGLTVCPQDYSWDAEDLAEGIYVALSGLRESSIIVHNGVAFIGHWVGYNSNNHDLQLMYNAITWSKYQLLEHDIKVILQAPEYVIPNETTVLNATVSNIGLNNETDVDLFLLINGNSVNSIRVPEMLSGSSCTINYLWTPTIEGTYNVTAYAPPVSGENYTYNNRAEKIVIVAYPLIHPVERQCANYTLSRIDINTGTIAGAELWNLTYDHYVSPYRISVTFWSKDPTGHIMTGSMIVNIMNRWVESGIWAGMWYPGWIETNITLGSTINLLDRTATVIGSHVIYALEHGIYPIDCWEVFMEYYGYEYTFWYDKASGLWVGMEYTMYPYRYELKLAATNIPLRMYEHELAVFLDAPSRLEPKDSVLLNATVYNVGLNNERNVELQLLINGTVIDFTIISKLEVGSSHVLSHLWTPTIENKYNVTAYAVPVPGENMITNNMQSAIVSVQILPDILIVADNDGGYYIRGTSLPEFESALKAANYDYFVWDELSMGHPPLDYLTKFNLVIWTCGDYWSGAVDPTDATTLEAYLAQGGNIILEGEDIGYDHHDDRFMVNVAHAIFKVDYTGAPGLTVTNPTHPVTRDLPTTIAWVTYPPYDDGVSPTNGGFEVIRYIGTEWTAVTVFGGTSSGYVVYYAFPLYCLEQSIRYRLVINSIERDVAIVDVTVSPTVVTAGETVTIEVAVENQGTITETFDVAVYYDDILIETSTVVNLSPYDSSNLFFYWDTLGVAGIVYEIKAVASVVPHEIDIENNIFVDGTVTVYPPIDVYTQRGGRGEGAWSDAYAPQEEVIIFASMTYKGDPLENKLVAFEVHDPTGYVWLFRSNSTDENGIAIVSFRIPSSPVFGTWNAIATGDIAGQTFNDTVTFKVGWIIEVTQVKTVDNYGNPKTSFTKDEHIYFNVTVQNIAFTSKEVTITIVVYDECEVPIGQVTLQNWVIGLGRTEIFIIDLQIPKWAYVGNGTVYANAYTRLPQEGGTPYCPETSTVFLIKAS